MDKTQIDNSIKWALMVKPLGGNGCMVGVGLKAHLCHALNFEAISCTKTYF